MRGDNMDTLRCIGCGSILQSTDETKGGYVPLHKLKDNEENVVCKRCYRLAHYNEVLPTTLNEEDFFNLLSSIPSENALIVHLIDLVDIEGTLIPQIKRLTNNNDLILVGNKIDLLPTSVRPNKYIHNLKEIAGMNDLKPSKIMVMSAQKNHGLDEVIRTIIDEAGQRDVYVVGMTNVGKSTFINHVLKSVKIIDHDLITVSHHPGTTLDFIKIPIDDNFLIDTPGILNKTSIRKTLSQASLKVITPKKEIKPKTYQLNSGQTLFLGGLARIDFKNKAPIGVTVYCANQLTIHRTKTSKADALLTEQVAALLTPPFSKEEVSSYKKVSLKIPKGKSNLVLPGLGFVTLSGRYDCDVYVDQHVTPYVRRALI